MIKFFNINSGETRVCDTEPMIAAFWGSSDRSPNVSQGQDRGWRLAPETVVEIKRITKDPRMIETIALKYQLPTDNITETDILAYISDTADKKTSGMDQTGQDFAKQYEDEIRALEAQNQRTAVAEAEAGTVTPVQAGVITAATAPTAAVEPVESAPEPEPVDEAPVAPWEEPAAAPEATPELGDNADLPSESEETPAPEEPVPSLDLTTFTRPELEEYASGLGIKDVAEFPNKPALIEAINKLQDEELGE